MSARDIRLDEPITNAVFASLKDYGMSVDVDAFHAALTAAGYAVEQGWRTIDTAPRDGTAFHAWVDGECRRVCWTKTSHVPIYGFCLTDQGAEDCDLCDPTAWRPLPAPPAGEATP